MEENSKNSLPLSLQEEMFKFFIKKLRVEQKVKKSETTNVLLESTGVEKK